MKERPGRLLKALGRDRGFLVAIELSSSMSWQGSLCRDMVLR